MLHGPQQAIARDGADPDAERAELLGADDAGTADVEREVHAMQVAIVGTHARLPEQAALGLHEVLEVTLGEGAHRGHAGRTRGGGHVDDLVFGNAAQLAKEAADALRITLRLLVDEGELLQVSEAIDFRRDARLIPGAFVVETILVGELELVLEVAELQFLELLARHGLDLFVVVLLVIWNVLLCHAELLSCDIGLALG